MRLRVSAGFGACVCLALAGCGRRPGFDTGSDPAAAAAEIGRAHSLETPSGRWLRVRGVPDPSAANAGQVAREREALAELRGRGFRTCVLLSASAGQWRSDVRMTAGARIPLDLREARDWVARLDAAYGKVVDAWEIDNEPDIGFVAENPGTYAAYLKACCLGAHGATGKGGRPLVLMAPLALPPGPYLEQLAGNGLLSYTDGFNYHYYGYAGDFTGVYRQFERAVGDLGREGGRKRLPVFMTECGYGMLGGEAAETVKGRVGQWRWFRSVAEQIRALRPEGAMMFLLRPYLERDLTEFGLEMREPDRLSFTPEDFGEERPEPWMGRIGRPMGGGVESPALAYLIDYEGGHPYAPRSWAVRAPEPSPVVIDFLDGQGMRPIKSFQGYALRGEGPEKNAGSGQLRIYNFSSRTISGAVAFEGPVSVDGGATRLELKPRELRVLPARVAVRRTPWEGHSWTVKFVPDRPKESASVFSTVLYPDWTRMRRKAVEGFPFPAERAANRRKALLARPLAEEEPALVPEGRWLVTPGVRVRDDWATWEFEVDRLPGASLRPAEAELPLPEEFTVPEHCLLRLDLRCESAGSGRSRYAGFSAAKGGIMQVQFRTENGNLYEVWPRRALNDPWQAYEEAGENFTMSFYGRAEPPWRFMENRPAALVFTFWPRALPTKVQVRAVGWARPE